MTDLDSIQWNVIRVADCLNNITRLQHLVSMAVEVVDDQQITAQVRQTRLDLLLEVYQHEIALELKDLEKYLETARAQLSHCRREI